MLAAVAPDSRYENLRNYVIGNGRGGRPTAVQAFDQSARQPVDRPTGALPGVKTPIPTSSARPGKATNQRIPYARLCFNFPTTGNPLMKQEVQEGDISFVHRPSNVNGKHCVPGHGPNRASTIGNIAQMNAMLSNHNTANRGDLTMDPTKDVFGILRVPDVDVNTNIQKTNPYTNAPLWRNTTWTERWADCKALGRWTPDGVIISAEHQHGTPIPLTGGMESNPGDLWNICIQGPTPLKNGYITPTDFANSYKEQNIDAGPRVLDKVFVGMFATENRDAAGINQYYSYYWKPFTARQVMWADLAGDALARVAPAPGVLNQTSGPTASDFTRLVSAWRVGTIMDAKLTKDRVQINVCIEEWPLDWLRDEYNALVGASVALRMRSVGQAVLNATQILSEVAPELNSTAPGRDLVNRFNQLNAIFNVTEAQGASTDPFGFGATIGELTEEAKQLQSWLARQDQWDNLNAKQRKAKKLTDPGPSPVPSPAMRTFFTKMNDPAAGPIAALARIFVEEAPSREGETQLTSIAALIGRAASYAEDPVLYGSLTDEEKVLVGKAQVATALIAKLRGPLQLYQRISLMGMGSLFTRAEDQGEEAGVVADGPLGVGELDPDDF